LKYYDLHQWVNYCTPKSIVELEEPPTEVGVDTVVYQCVAYRKTKLFSHGGKLLISYDDLQDRHKRFWGNL
jgi:hypothetical protein